ncbi:MAG: methyltransferase domain-containing protein [Pseudomonadota bacterium]
MSNSVIGKQKRKNPEGLPAPYSIPEFLTRSSDPEFICYDPDLSEGNWQLCTSRQILDPKHKAWMAKIDEPDILHRKKWDYSIIIETLSAYGILKPGASGIGFGVGREPLVSLFASYGCTVLATDLPLNNEHKEKWDEVGSHSSEKSQLFYEDLISREKFDRLVSFMPVNMTEIPTDLYDEPVDFVWSTSALEHVGTHKGARDFVMNSAKMLKPGGIVVHTSEINLTSKEKTVELPTFYLWTRKSIEALRKDLRAEGYRIRKLNLHPGAGKADQIVNNVLREGPVMKRQKRGFAFTSFSIIIEKP